MTPGMCAAPCTFRRVLVRSVRQRSVDLARLAGLPAAGVICEVVDLMGRWPDSVSAGVPSCGIPVVTVRPDRYRLRHERLVSRERAKLPTAFGSSGVLSGIVSGGSCPSFTATSMEIRHRWCASTTVMISDVHGMDFSHLVRVQWTLKRIVHEGSGVLLYCGWMTPLNTG